MQGQYLTRAAAAYIGLYGNDLEEACYHSLLGMVYTVGTGRGV